MSINSWLKGLLGPVSTQVLCLYHKEEGKEKQEDEDEEKESAAAWKSAFHEQLYSVTRCGGGGRPAEGPG